MCFVIISVPVLYRKMNSVFIDLRKANKYEKKSILKKKSAQYFSIDNTRSKERASTQREKSLLFIFMLIQKTKNNENRCLRILSLVSFSFAWKKKKKLRDEEKMKPLSQDYCILFQFRDRRKKMMQKNENPSRQALLPCFIFLHTMKENETRKNNSRRSKDIFPCLVFI